MGTRGVVSSASSSRSAGRDLVKSLRTESLMFRKGSAAQCSSSSSSSLSPSFTLTWSIGVSVDPWSGAPGGSVTSALHVGHCSSVSGPARLHQWVGDLQASSISTTTRRIHLCGRHVHKVKSLQPLHDGMNPYKSHIHL